MKQTYFSYKTQSLLIFQVTYGILPCEVQDEQGKSQNVIGVPMEPTLINCVSLKDPRSGERHLLNEAMVSMKMENNHSLKLP